MLSAREAEPIASATANSTQNSRHSAQPRRCPLCASSLDAQIRAKQQTQLFGFDWLRKVVVEARRQRPRLVGFLPPSSHSDQGDSPSQRPSAYLPRDFIAVESRHANVEHGDLR